MNQSNQKHLFLSLFLFKCVELLIYFKAGLFLVTLAFVSLAVINPFKLILKDLISNGLNPSLSPSSFPWFARLI